MTLKELIRKHLRVLEEMRNAALELARAKLSSMQQANEPGQRGFRYVVIDPLSAMDFMRMILKGDLRTFLLLVEDLLKDEPKQSSNLAQLRAIRVELEDLPEANNGDEDWDVPEPFDPTQCG